MTETFKWKIHEAHFRGPGKYGLGEGKDRIEFLVDERGFFELPATKLPVYAIAKAS